MAKVDITGLLTGLAGTPDLEREGIKRASAIQGQGAGSNLARGQALRAPQREQMMRQGAGGLFGVDTRTAGQQVQEQLGQLDTSTPEGQKQAVQLIAQVDPARALALRTRFAEENKALTARTAATDSDKANRENIALKMESLGYNDLAKSVRAEGPSGKAETLKAALKIITQNAKPQAASVGGAAFQKGTTFTVQDANEQNFTMVAGFDKDAGKVVNSYAALDGSDTQPTGAVVITGGEFGLTAGNEGKRKTGQVSDETAEKEFQVKRSEQMDLIPNLSVSADKIARAGELLDSFPTGGPLNKFALGVENFLGVKPANKAEAEIIMGNEMYKTLKPLFGGLISDSEAARIEKIYWSMGKGNAANAGIIKELSEQVRQSLVKAELYRKAGSAKEYAKMVGQMFPVGSSKAKPVAKPDYIISILEQYNEE